MKFYINTIENHSGLSLPENISEKAIVIGLYRECAVKQLGYNCGWYGGESYINTKVYAYGVTEGDVDHCEWVGDVKICNPAIKYKEIGVRTFYWTRVIEADSLNEAIELFRDAKWRSWDSKDDMNLWSWLVEIKAMPVRLRLWAAEALENIKWLFDLFF